MGGGASRGSRWHAAERTCRLLHGRPAGAAHRFKKARRRAEPAAQLHRLTERNRLRLGERLHVFGWFSISDDTFPKQLFIIIDIELKFSLE